MGSQELITQQSIEKWLEINPSLDVMMVADLKGDVHAFQAKERDTDESVTSDLPALLSHAALALQEVCRILSDHLQLDKKIEELEIVGKDKTIWIKNVSDSFFLQAISSSRQDVTELRDNIIEFLLKDILSHSSAETIAMVSSDGFPIWFVGKHNLAQVATIAANVLSAAERLNIELKLGSIDFVEMSNLTENVDKTMVFFNEAQDLMLLLIGTKSSDEVLKIIEIAEKIFRTHVRQEHSTLILPPSWMLEREEKIKEILEETSDTTYSSDTTEEIRSLRQFNEETLNQLVDLLKDLYRRYRCREVSIPYLCKKLKLPPMVMNVVLQSLLFEGRLGNSRVVADPKTKTIFLRLDWSIMKKKVDERLIQDIDAYKNQIIRQVIETHLSQYSRLFMEEPEVIGKVTSKTMIETRFSEIQMLIDLVDTSEIRFLVQTLRKEWQRLQELRKSALLLEKQLQHQKRDVEGTDLDVVLSELEKRYQNLQRKIKEQNILIISYKKRLNTSIIEVLKLIQVIFPQVMISKRRQKRKRKSSGKNVVQRAFIACASLTRGDECVKKVQLPSHDDYNWVQLYFMQLMYHEFIQNSSLDVPQFLVDSKSNVSESVKDVVNCWKILKDRYSDFIQDNHNEMQNSQLMELLDALERIFFTKSELHRHYSAIQKSKGYEMFGRCQACGKWYCVSRHYNLEKERCVFCDA